MSRVHYRPLSALYFATPQDPADALPAGAGMPVRCTVCPWTGRYDRAFEHHRENRHHPIVFTNNPQLGPLRFGCCAEDDRAAEGVTE